MTSVPQLFDRAHLVPGLLVSRRATAPISKGILLATGQRTEPIWKLPVMGYDAYVDTIVGLTHDAMFVIDPSDGVLKIGDALGGKVNSCVYTPIETWERVCVEEGNRIIVGRPAGATNEQLAAAAKWWSENVAGKQYDKVALGQLLVKAALGDWISYKVGLYSRFFCTEGVQAALASPGCRCDPYWPNKNGTPGTTAKRYAEGRFELELRALTVEGAGYLANFRAPA